MDDLKKRVSPVSSPSEKRNRAIDRFADALVFVGFLMLSVLAIAAVAVATPLVLVLSVLAGLFEKNHDSNGWHSANA